MMRLIKYLFLLAVILVTSLYIILLFVDLNHFKNPIEKQVSGLLNRKVTVGQIDLKMSLVPKLSIKNLTIQNPDDFKAEHSFAHVGTTDLTLSIIPLFRGIVQVDAIHLSDAKIYFIKNENKNNWTFSDEKSSEKSNVSKIYTDNRFDVRRVKVEQISISDSVVTYISGKKREMAVLKSFALNQLENATMQINYKKTPFQLTFATSNVLQVLRSGYLKDFNLNVKAYDGLVKISGQAENIYSLKNMNFAVDISSPDFGKTLALMGEKEVSELASGKPFSMVFGIQGSLEKFNLLGLSAEIKNMANLTLNSLVENVITDPKITIKLSGEVKSYDVTNKYGVKPVTVDLDALYAQKSLLLNKLSLFVNRSDVFAKGKIDLSNSVPFVKGELYSNYFDLADIVSEKENLSNKVASGTSFENIRDEKIELSFLKDLNADLNISFSNLKLLKTDKDYHEGSVHILLNDGILSVKPYKFNFLNGTVSGEAQLNSSANPMQAYFKLKGLGLLVSDLEDVTPHLRDATANILLNVNSKGDSVKSLMSGLNGEVKAQLSSGLIVNKWFNSLPSLIGIVTKNSAFSYADTETQSELNCAAISLDIKDGVVKSDRNIAVETSVMNLVVSGDIDLGKENLSLSLIPSLNHLNSKANKKLSFAQYIRLEGPFSNIKMREDARSALEDLKDKEVEKLKRKLTGVKSDKKETYIPIGGLCELALGEDVFSAETKKTIESMDKKDKDPSQKNKTQTVKESLKEKVKDQITKSLTEILKRK